MEATMSDGPLPLPHVDQVVPRSASDEECFAELRAVLARHHALQRFGILLLHEHFEVAHDEVLVEECDVVRRVLTIAPRKLEKADGNVLETSWRLDTGEAAHRCLSRCLRDPLGSHRDVHDDRRR